MIRPVVWPSAGAWAIALVPTMPPAPVLFSTTTGWLMVLVISVAMMRASTSVVPPGGNDEMMRIGLVGYCASAVALRTSEAAASASFGAVMRTSLVLQTRRKLSPSAKNRKFGPSVAGVLDHGRGRSGICSRPRADIRRTALKLRAKCMQALGSGFPRRFAGEVREFFPAYVRLSASIAC